MKPDASFENPTSANSLSDEIWKRHSAMLAKLASDSPLPPRTLIICNTVDWAIDVHALLAKEKPMGSDLLLLHSRFRPPERREQMKRLETATEHEFRGILPNGQIVVATQVIEAGVDVTSGVLWSEVAPLASLVQRIGRLNRAGEFNGSEWEPLAIVVGVGVEVSPPREIKEEAKKREDNNAGRCLPYELPACETAWAALLTLSADASPASLEQIQAAVAASIPRCPYSLQRHELTDFFDTDANLSLGFTDVSPFVRGLDDDTDLQVLWRESWQQKDGVEGTGEPGFSPDFQRDELCSVPIGKARHAREILNQGWIWRGQVSGCPARTLEVPSHAPVQPPGD